MISNSYKYSAARRFLARLITVSALLHFFACERPVVHQTKDRDGVVYTPLPPLVAKEGNADIKNQQPAGVTPGSLAANTAQCKTLYAELLKALVSTVAPADTAPRLQPEVASLLTAVNSARRDAGVRALQPDPNLILAALVQAEDMVRRGFFDHVSPEGCGLSHRITLATDFGAGLVGEVIARGQETAAATLAAWLDSPAHRRNVLDPRHLRIGLAVAAAAQRENALEGGPRVNLHWVVVLGKSGTDPEPPPVSTPAEVEAARRGALRAMLGTYRCPDGTQSVPAVPAPAGGNTNGQTSGPPICTGPTGAFSAVTSEMRALCLKWGGGSATCSSERWSERMMISARGTGTCPMGSSFRSEIKYCTEGTVALGPFPGQLVEHCKKTGTGNSNLMCLPFFMDKSVLEDLLQ